MRSAFIRWLRLHNEDFRSHGYVRIPNWFRWYIRNNYEWSYQVYSKNKNHYKAPCNRMYKGFYQFEIS